MNELRNGGRGLVLGNIDYLLHTSDEGHQLQQGLVDAGWEIAGVGYGDGCADVPTLLERYQPEAVFVQDVRDWLPESNISFRKDIGFTRIEALGDSACRCYTVLKDAWGWHPEQSKVAGQIDATAIATYYHHNVVRDVAPWTDDYNLLRIYHSMDGELWQEMFLGRDCSQAQRKRAIVTGADAKCYPLRRLALRNAAKLGLDTMKHPGYGNRGADTPRYLREISQYRLHVATASKWEVAFRKIIESVCCGCTPITNLSPDDKLPVIDAALVRVPTNISVPELQKVIAEADAQWDWHERQNWAINAINYYDYRQAGRRFSEMMGVPAP